MFEVLEMPLCVCVCVLVMTVSYVKTAEPIEMLFSLYRMAQNKISHQTICNIYAVQCIH